MNLAPLIQLSGRTRPIKDFFEWTKQKNPIYEGLVRDRGATSQYQKKGREGGARRIGLSLKTMTLLLKVKIKKR